MWKLISYLADKLPGLIESIKKGKRADEVTKIDDDLASGNDKSITSELRKVVEAEDKRRKANS